MTLVQILALSIATLGAFAIGWLVRAERAHRQRMADVEEHHGHLLRLRHTVLDEQERRVRAVMRLDESRRMRSAMVAIDRCRGQHDPSWREGDGFWRCSRCGVPLDAKRRGEAPEIVVLGDRRKGRAS